MNATCFNLAPSFFCDCNFGFTGDGKQCDGKKKSAILAYLLYLIFQLNNAHLRELHLNACSKVLLRNG